MNILQVLYDEEINAFIETYWDAGFNWGLGFEGKLDNGTEDSYEKAVESLIKAAIKTYPELADKLKLDEVSYCEWTLKGYVWYNSCEGKTHYCSDHPREFNYCPNCRKETKILK